MYNARLGLNIPRFSIPDIKELERALNTLSDSIQDCAELIPTINVGNGLIIRQTGKHYTLEADPEPIRIPASRFEVKWDSISGKIFVSEGRVAFLTSNSLDVVVPKLGGGTIARPLSSDGPITGDEIPYIRDSEITGGDSFGVFLMVKGRIAEIKLYKIVEGIYYGDWDYHLELARVNKDATTGILVIDQKWSSDVVLYVNKSDYCPFEVTDITTYNEQGDVVGEYTLEISNWNTLDGKRYAIGYASSVEWTIPSYGPFLSHPYIYVYLSIPTDSENDYFIIDEDTISASIQLSSIPLDNGSIVQNFLICRLSVLSIVVTEGDTSTTKKYLTNIANQCPIIALDKDKACNFAIEEGEFDSQSFVIRREQYAEGAIPFPLSEQATNFPIGYLYSGNSGVDFTYPWQVLYLKFILDGEGNLDKQQDPYVSIRAYDRYQKSNPYEHFVPIAEVTYGYTESDNPVAYVTSIKNYCPEPPYFVENSLCDFNISDYSTYDENGVNPINAVVRIKKTPFLGRYPLGMDLDGDPFTVTITDEDVDESGRCHFYVTALVNEYGFPYDYDSAVYIEYGKYSDLKTGHSLQRLKIGVVETELSNGDRVLVPQKIQNLLCPAQVLPATVSCKFQVDDVSSPYDPNNDIVIQIRTDSIDGRYPYQMVQGERYLQTLSEDNNWYAIYLCADYMPSGTVSLLNNELYFTVENDYKKSDAYTERYLIAEVTISYRTDSKRYISYIQSYCYQPELVKSNSCPFKIVDASTTGALAIVVRSTKVQGQFPSGMSYDDFFYLTVDTNDSLWFSVYCGMSINQSTGAIDAMWVSLYTTYKVDDADTQYKLLGEVEVLYDEESNPYLYITNRCPAIDIYRYFSACSFRIKDITDYTSEDITPSISIDYGTVSGKVPEGMTLENPYVLEPVEGGNYIYLVILFDETTLEISDQENAVTIGIYSEAKLNTTTIQYILIGTASWNSTSNTLTIYSVCTQPSANACLLKWE